MVCLAVVDQTPSKGGAGAKAAGHVGTPACAVRPSTKSAVDCAPRFAFGEADQYCGCQQCGPNRILVESSDGDDPPQSEYDVVEDVVALTDRGRAKRGERSIQRGMAVGDAGVSCENDNGLKVKRLFPGPRRKRRTTHRWVEPRVAGAGYVRTRGRNYVATVGAQVDAGGGRRDIQEGCSYGCEDADRLLYICDGSRPLR